MRYQESTHLAFRLVPLLALVALGTVLVGCGGADKPVAPANEVATVPAPVGKAAVAPQVAAKPADPVTQKAFDAKATFKTTCASCHGESGKGDGPAAVALTPKPAAFGDAEFWATRDRAQIKKAIKEGGPAVGKSPLMAPFGAMFNEAQLDALVEHVMTFKPAG